jgi:hypothetical protein
LISMGLCVSVHAVFQRKKWFVENRAAQKVESGKV